MKRYQGLTKAQFEALLQIAFGGHPICHPRTLEVLLKKGLVIKIGERAIYGKGNSPIDRIPIMVDQYEMPIAEHMKYCYWCSENCEGE